MIASNGIDLLAGALARAQQEFKPIVKDCFNPYFGSMYADLSGVIAATQPALARHGLVVVQDAKSDNEKKEITVTTTLVHSSGQLIETTLTMPATMKAKDGNLKFDAQSIGAAFTYARRYAYQGIVGVAAEPDEDSEDHGSKEAAQAVAERKKATAAGQNGKESVEFIPGANGMTFLRGLKGIPVMRAEAGPKLVTRMTWMDKHSPPMWAIPDDAVQEFVDLAKKLGIQPVKAQRTVEGA